VLNFPPTVRIWLACQAVDLRRSFDGLAEQVRQHLHADPWTSAWTRASNWSIVRPRCVSSNTSFTSTSAPAHPYNVFDFTRTRQRVGEAIAYAFRNWPALVRYTEAGFLAIDNNVSEREMKRIAIGRKNWLFVGSPQGGATAAVLISFTSTCQRLGVEPWSYLADILARLPATAVGDVDALLPDRWQALRKSSASPSEAAATNPPSARVGEPLE
jgi:hypothetical protein